MVPESKIEELLEKYKKQFPGCVFRTDRLAEFLCSGIFEAMQEFRDSPLLLLASTAIVERYLKQNPDVYVSMYADSGTVHLESTGKPTLSADREPEFASLLVDLARLLHRE